MRKSYFQLVIEMKKFLIYFLDLMLIMSGCSKADEGHSKPIRIGISYYDSYDPFIEKLSKEIEETLNEEENIIVNSQDAEKSQTIQNRQVSEMLKEGYDVICVNLVDRTAPKKIISMAEDADVPVIFFNRELVSQDLDSWVNLYYVGANAKESGELEGEIAAETILENPDRDKNGDGKIQYIVMEGEAGHQDAIVRTDVSIQTLTDAGISLDKLDYAIANWNRAQAYTKMKQFITTYGTEIELVLCNNDEMALGTIQALQESGIPESEWPVITGVDGMEEGLQEVKKGTMAGTVYNDGIGQAKAIAKLSISLAKNENLDHCHLENGKYIRLSYQKVTQENVDDYLNVSQ